MHGSPICEFTFTSLSFNVKTNSLLYQYYGFNSQGSGPWLRQVLLKPSDYSERIVRGCPVNWINNATVCFSLTYTLVCLPNQQGNTLQPRQQTVTNKRSIGEADVVYCLYYFGHSVAANRWTQFKLIAKGKSERKWATSFILLNLTTLVKLNTT